MRIVWRKAKPLHSISHSWLPTETLGVTAVEYSKHMEVYNLFTLLRPRGLLNSPHSELSAEGLCGLALAVAEPCTICLA